MVLPHVAVVGAGPAGLLTALFLTRRGFDVSVFESSKEPENRSTNSYSIFLNDKGQAALQRADMLEAVRAASFTCHWTVLHHQNGSEETILPFIPSHLAITRPRLVQCLTEQLMLEGRARLRRNATVLGLRRNIDCRMLHLKLADGSEPDATHIVAADGKWSIVRQAAAKLAQEEGWPCYTWRTHVQSNWEIQLCLSNMPPDWDKDAVHVIESKTLGESLTGMLYQIIPDKVHGKLMLRDPILDRHVWLGSRAELLSRHEWEDLGGREDTAEWERALGKLVSEELPPIPPEAAYGARLGRRESWLEVTVAGRPRFDSLCGRLVLVGDSAHSSTARLGEGCNLALESAAALDEAIGWELARRELIPGSAAPAAAAAAEAGGGPTAAEAAGPIAAGAVAAEGDAELSMAFENYGVSRAAALHQQLQLRREKGIGNWNYNDDETASPSGPGKCKCFG